MYVCFRLYSEFATIRPCGSWSCARAFWPRTAKEINCKNIDFLIKTIRSARARLGPCCVCVCVWRHRQSRYGERRARFYISLMFPLLRPNNHSMGEFQLLLPQSLCCIVCALTVMCLCKCCMASILNGTTNTHRAATRRLSTKPRMPRKRKSRTTCAHFCNLKSININIYIYTYISVLYAVAQHFIFMGVRCILWKYIYIWQGIMGYIWYSAWRSENAIGMTNFI